MSITRHIQSVLRDNPGRSWNDLVHSTLLQRLSATTGTVSDLWARWLNGRGYPYSSLSDMLQAYWNHLNVPTEERNFFTLGWFELFSTPLPLFSNGEQGAWYDPSDMSTLFQDAAGTTPVTALGQPVGRILDKSGRGNHLTQTTAASRPLWRQDANGAFHLAFDGVDDFLTIGTFNMSASDKVTVCAGVRKLSDAAPGTIAELSTSAIANAGSFRLRAPEGAVGDYGFVTGGTIAGVLAQSPATFPSPITSVLVGIGDIGGDVSRLRVNGAQVANTTADQGAGNYGAAYPLFVGRRNGATLPFNGNLYGLVIRGTEATTPQITALERYMARQTGIAL